MKLHALLNTLDKLCPFALQEDFDNSGLQVGDGEKEVQRIFLAFDFTEAVLSEAVAKKADVIITHHPFLFQSLKSVSTEEWRGKMIFRLIREDMALIALHTNLDKIDFGVNMQLGKDLGLTDLRVLLPDESGMGLGALGLLPAEMTLEALTAKVRQDLHRPAVKYAGDATQGVRRVAVLGGAGAEFMEEAQALGAEVYISSDFKYHDAQKARNIGMNIIDAGHFGTEAGVVKALAATLKAALPEAEIITCTCMKDYWEYK